MTTLIGFTHCSYGRAMYVLHFFRRTLTRYCKAGNDISAF